MTNSTCKVDECQLDVRASGYCENHRYRWRKYGDPLGGQIRGDDSARFWAQVVEGAPPAAAPSLGPCWIWNGRCGNSGYGTFTFRVEPGVKRQGCAHRWAYEQMVVEIPEGLVLDHLCRVQRCVRPDHLEPVTTRVNTERGLLAATTRARHQRTRGAA